MSSTRIDVSSDSQNIELLMVNTQGLLGLYTVGIFFDTDTLMILILNDTDTFTTKCQHILLVYERNFYF